ncbi:MAG: hypothetical protein R3C12_01895 [Planctomycetaceae bacterium]|nr:hypothetical protein [Planctomycetaceae bacterium]
MATSRNRSILPAHWLDVAGIRGQNAEVQLERVFRDASKNATRLAGL